MYGERGCCQSLLDTLKACTTAQNCCATLAKEKNAIYFVRKQSTLQKWSYTVLNFIWLKKEAENEQMNNLLEDLHFSPPQQKRTMSTAALKVAFTASLNLLVIIYVCHLLPPCCATGRCEAAVRCFICTLHHRYVAEVGEAHISWHYVPGFESHWFGKAHKSLPCGCDSLEQELRGLLESLQQFSLLGLWWFQQDVA